MATFSLGTLRRGADLTPAVGVGGWHWPPCRPRSSRETAQSDAAFCSNYAVWIEQEPGSGGKESVENTIRMLRGYRAYADKVTGNKELRAEPYAAQVQGGDVRLLGLS